MIKKKLFILLAAAGTMTVSCVDNNYKLIVIGGEFAGKISWSGYMDAEFNGVKYNGSNTLRNMFTTFVSTTTPSSG